MHSFFNCHPLITTVQSIPCVFLLQFGENNRDLVHTFVFNKLAFYDVVIPGRESEIHLRMPIDAMKLQTKFQVDSVSVTMENLSIFVSNNIFIPLEVENNQSVLSMYIVLHDWTMVISLEAINKVVYVKTPL